MAEYSGKDMQSFFGSAELTQLTRVRINPEADEPDEYDVTHATDTQKQILEGLAGAAKTGVEVACYDESGGSHALMDLTVGDQDTFTFYPEGKVHGNPQCTVSSATLLTRPVSAEHNAPVELEATFKSATADSWDTYSSA